MPKLSDACEQSCKLLDRNSVFMWESKQDATFISSSPVLKYYDISSEATIQCYDSNTGLGAKNQQLVSFMHQWL